MSEIPQLPGQVGAPVGARGDARTRATSSGASGGVAFEALLERLSARAADLEERSRTLATPEELPGAMDAARASLEDAVALGTELLEAYRASQTRGDAT